MNNKEYNTKLKTRLMGYIESHKDTHFCAKDAYESLNDDGVDANLTTIYRNLEKLSERGILTKYKTTGKGSASYRYSDTGAKCNHHLHLQCKKCGHIYHLNCSFMDSISTHLQADHGFTLECSESVLLGVCENCNKKMQMC